MNTTANHPIRRKRNVFLVLFLFAAGCLVVLFFLSFREKPALPEPPAGPDPYAIDSARTAEYDVLSEILRFNSDTSLHIPLSFRSGHVEKISFENYLSTTDYGYCIDLKNTTPVLTPLVAGNRIYVSGGFGSKNYYSFNLGDGSLNWAVLLDDDGPSSAVVSRSSLVFNTESCTIFCLDLLSGEMRWSHWLGDPLLATPAVAGNSVYTTYSNQEIHWNTVATDTYTKIKPSHPLACFDLRNGNVNWQKWLDGDVLSSPVVYKEHLYLTTLSGTVYKIAKNTGEFVACSKLGATSVPSIRDGKVFVTRRTERKGAVKETIAVLSAQKLEFIREFNEVPAPYLDAKIQDRSSLKQRAAKLDMGNGFYETPVTAGAKSAAYNLGQSNVSTLQSYIGSPILFQNELLLCQMGDSLYCIDPVTSAVRWKKNLGAYDEQRGGRMTTSPVLVNNTLITVSLDGDVQLYDATSGKLLKTYALKTEVRNQPVVSSGYIIVPGANGKIYCVNTNDKTIDGWAMLLKNPAHDINAAD